MLPVAVPLTEMEKVELPPAVNTLGFAESEAESVVGAAAVMEEVVEQPLPTYGLVLTQSANE